MTDQRINGKTVAEWREAVRSWKNAWDVQMIETFLEAIEARDKRIAELEIAVRAAYDQGKIDAVPHTPITIFTGEP